MAKKEFECPNCAASGVVEIDYIVRVSENHDVTARVLCGEYFEWECPGCGNQFLIDDVFLYYDDTRGFMVYYVPGYKEPKLKAPTLIKTKDGFDVSGSTLRVTARFHDLAEKIRIFEAGLDDRVIETVKFYCSVNYSDAGQTIDDILFEEIDENGTLFFSVYHGSDCIGLPLPMDGYLRAQSDFAQLFESAPQNVFEMVDQRWFSSLLDHKNET